MYSEFPPGPAGGRQFDQVWPKSERSPPPRAEQHGNIFLLHHADEVGLYTEQEEHDFEHVSGLLHYKEQVTETLVHEICAQDDECELIPLPGSHQIHCPS